MSEGAARHTGQAVYSKSAVRKPPEGHEGYLAAMVKNRTNARLTLTNGSVLLGILTAFDKFTISILPHGRDFPETFFKHGVLSFTRDFA